MSEARWMPGPWEQWNYHGRTVVTRIKSADRTVICTLAEGADAWVNAHARLLKAAPDLYEAAATALATCSPYAAEKIRAAMAKAEGRAP